MNGNTQKLVAYVALVLVAAALLCVWGLFAFYGKTDIAAFIAKLSDLLGIVVAAISALGAVHVYGISRSGSQAPTQPSKPAAAPTQIEQQ
jgi:high-affinity Fe2+/Pb2+ permease